MLEFHLSNIRDIRNGNFPLNHDCIIKVDYIQGTPLRFSYFTCCAQHSGTIVDFISKLPVVKKVYVFDVESFEL